MNSPEIAPRGRTPWIIRWPHRARARLWLACLSGLLLASCSLVGLGYNRLPTIAYWWLDGMLDLDDRQAVVARAELDAFHEWHRRTQLPLYAQQLRTWQTWAVQELSPAQVCQAADAARGLFEGLVLHSVEPMARLAQTLGPAQLAHWQRHHQRKDDEFRADFLKDRRKGEDKRTERALDRYEDFYGRLDASQRDWLRERLARSPYDPERHLAERQRRQADWHATMQRIRDGAPAASALRAVWERTLVSPTPGYAAYARAVLEDGCAQMAELHNRTTPAQRQKAIERLRGYERELLALSRRE
jgi:Family of unknown function (DUF6279)